MVLHIDSAKIIDYLKQFIVNNKARGMAAELSLHSELGLKSSLEQKLLPGGWLISPKIPLSQHYRYLISVLPNLYSDSNELQNAVHALENERGWQALATFMSQSGIGVIVSGALAPETVGDLENLQWKNYIYQNEILLLCNDDEPFVSWPGNRGRPSTGGEWQSDVMKRFEDLKNDDLMGLAMRQSFFYGYLKQRLRKPVDDPYDVDAFVVGFTGIVMPVEIKEKSPTPSGDFGIDAGRILMLLRLCLATDSNALYVIRQVDETETRELVKWRYVTLADIITGCHWNLTGGGRGMSGGATQTVIIPGSLFEDFSQNNLSEEWLAQNKSLQASVKMTANELVSNITRYLNA